jgi:RNA polymerase sigma-70 factor, ECF subfamily
MAVQFELRTSLLSQTLTSTGAAAEHVDAELVRAAQRGDRSAFGELYTRYARMVHGILLARVPRTAAEDLVHDVFVQALPQLASLRDPLRFGGWLAAIARNRAADFYRKARTCNQFDAESTDHEMKQHEHPAEASLILEAVRALPEAYRETLILRFVEGMTGPEIAARTGLTHGSVRVNLHRGMQQLREQLGLKSKAEAPAESAHEEKP